MQRRRNITRKQKKGKLFIVFVLLIVCGVASVEKAQLVKKSEALAVKQEQLQRQIKEAEKEKEQLVKQEKYMQTKEYAEEVAREKFGMIKKNEIIFKAKGK